MVTRPRNSEARSPCATARPIRPPRECPTQKACFAPVFASAISRSAGASSRMWSSTVYVAEQQRFGEQRDAAVPRQSIEKQSNPRAASAWASENGGSKSKLKGCGGEPAHHSHGSLEQRRAAARDGAAHTHPPTQLAPRGAH